MNYIRSILIRFIAKDVFHTLTVDDILTIKGGKYTWKGKELDENTLGAIKTQAKNFKDSTLWKVLKAEIQWKAAKTLLEKGRHGEDIRIAQIQGYLTTIIDNKLTELSDGSL